MNHTSVEELLTMCTHLRLAPDDIIPTFTYHIQAFLTLGHLGLDKKFYACPFVVFHRQLKARLLLLSRHLLGRTPYSSVNELLINTLEPCQPCCSLSAGRLAFLRVSLYLPFQDLALRELFPQSLHQVLDLATFLVRLF